MKTTDSPKRITLEDVARDAGVSRATASLVVRNSPLVADDTRQKVLASMDRLGYVYNRAAAMLRTQRSNTVGLVVTDISNPFFAQMTLGSETELDDASYALLLASTSENRKRQLHLLSAMYARGVDGILLCAARGTEPEDLAQLRSWNLPFVQAARYLPGVEADYVGSDNVLGAEMAVEHLVRLGHRRIAFVGGPNESSARRDRYAGYRRALDTAGLAVDAASSVTTPVTRTGGYEGIMPLLERSDPPTAALCYNDVVAFGVMLRLYSIGVRVGKDFAVVGFDDIEEAALWRPALTTISISPRYVGEMAARLLLSRIEDPDIRPRQCILDPELVVRDSCGGMP